MTTFCNRRQLFRSAAAASALSLAAQSQNQSQKKMRLGVITGVSKDPEAAIKHVHDLGFPTCQLLIAAFDDSTATKLRDALAKYGIEATSAVATGPPPEVYDFYKGPLTIGL